MPTEVSKSGRFLRLLVNELTISETGVAFYSKEIHDECINNWIVSSFSVCFGSRFDKIIGTETNFYFEGNGCAS